jgi:transcriptional regulator with XRE-family HTH domain
MTSEVIAFPEVGYDSLGDVVSSNLRAEVARRRIPQEQLAARLGMSQQAVSDRLRGRVKMSVDDLGRLADLLGLQPAELLVRHLGLEPRTRWFGFDGRLTRLFAWRARRGERTASAEVVSLSAYRAAAAVSA